MACGRESEGAPGPDVLLVEDSDADYLLLTRHVRKVLSPRRCQRAATRAELMKALTVPWDLIVTDLHLLEIEGSALLAAIEQAQPRTPCVVLSGSPVDGLHSAHDNLVEVLEKGDSAALRATLSRLFHGAG